MPKHEAGTPKDIAKRIKAKGLQKLRFYCQVCNKQCRDENGFKCHLTAESHRRQMALFAASPDKFMSEYSRDFENGYVGLLSRRFGTRKVDANAVYNEFIQDKHHVHMNSTMWGTLGDFVKYLGRTGKAKVEETERGWDIQYIDRSPDKLKREAEKERQRRREQLDEARHNRVLEGMAEKAAETLGPTTADLRPTKLSEEDRNNTKIESKIVLSTKKGRMADGSGKTTSEVKGLFSTDDTVNDTATSHHASSDTHKRTRWGKPVDSSAGLASSSTRRSGRTSQLEAILEQQKRSSDKHSKYTQRPPAGEATSPTNSKQWIRPGAMVRILNKDISHGEFYKRKGTIRKVEDPNTAQVRVKDSTVVLRLSDDALETIVPPVGTIAIILRGRYSGDLAVVQKLHVDDFCATLCLINGTSEGKELHKIDYEEFSKLDTKWYEKHVGRVPEI